MRQRDVRQAARRTALEAQRSHQARRAARDKRLRRHAETVLVALGERDAVVADREQTAGTALLAMTRDEGLSLAEAVGWCGGGRFTTREATVLIRRARSTLAAREAHLSTQEPEPADENLDPEARPSTEP